MKKIFSTQEPLISLHIPKCAGQSLALSVWELNNKGFATFPYYPEVGLHLPVKWNVPNVIIHGHFVRWKGFGIEAICPEARQFTTVIRDPFDVIVSGYFYGLQNKLEWAVNSNLNAFMDWWIDSGNTPLTGSLPSIWGVNSVSEYADKFVLIGVVDYLDSYVDQLGKILNTKLQPPLKVNHSIYSQKIPDRRSEFRQAMPFDFDFYDYVLDKYRSGE